MRLSYAEYGLAVIGVAFTAGYIATLRDMRKLEKNMANTKADLDDAITAVETVAAANAAATAANVTHGKQLTGIISDLTGKLTAAPSPSDVDFSDEIARLGAVKQSISDSTDALTKTIADTNADTSTPTPTSTTTTDPTTTGSGDTVPTGDTPPTAPDVPTPAE